MNVNELIPERPVPSSHALLQTIDSYLWDWPDNPNRCSWKTREALVAARNGLLKDEMKERSR